MQGQAGGPQYRVLVCVRERHVARLLERTLKRQGHTVKCEFSGREAIELLLREEFDRVILDHTLQDMSGYDVLKEIRENEATRDLWVLVMNPNEEGRRSFEQRPFEPNGYLEYPFNPVEIFSA